MFPDQPLVQFPAGIRIVLAAALLLLIATSTVRGNTYTWSVLSGDWSVASNWGGTAPTSLDDAYVINGGTAGVTLPDAVCNNLFLGDPNSANSGAIQMSGGSLAALAAEYLGNNGSGAFAQNGGANSCASLYVGYNAAASGVYALCGSGLLSAGSEYVGYSGTGTFNQSGGTNAVTSLFSLGGAGTYNLTEGVLIVPGIQGAGVFNLGGGTLVASAGFSASQAMTLTGSGNGNINNGGYPLVLSGILSGSGGLNLSGGGLLALTASNTFTGGTTLSAGILQVGNSSALGLPTNGLTIGGGTLDLHGQSVSLGMLAGGGAINNLSGTAAYTLSIGNDNSTSTFSGTLQNTSGQIVLAKAGTGTLTLAGNVSLGSSCKVNGGGLNQTAGNTTFANSLYLGYNLASTGAYNLSGAGVLFALDEYAGYAGTGTFTQSGGTNTSFGLNLGMFSSGSYNLSGSGLLAVNGETIGEYGTGTFTQSGGTNALGNQSGLYVGFGTGSSGAYNLSGSGLVSAALENVGYSGTGTFSQSGGTNNLANGNLYLGNSLSASGSYTLSAGSLSAGSESIGGLGIGNFTQSGGINSVSSSGVLSLGYSAGGNGSYFLSGSGLLSAGTETIGSSGSGTFAQSGGTNTVTNVLSLGGGGTYNLTGGLLLLPGIRAGGGVFNLGGGVLMASSGFSTSQAMTLTGSGGNGNINTSFFPVTFSGVLSGPGGLSVSGGSLLTLSGSNTYSGVTAVSGGTLQIGNGGSGEFLSSPSVSLSSSAALVFNHSDALTYGGSISGNGSVTQMGNGVLTLPGSNTFSGNTLISAGTLAIRGGGVLGGGNYSQTISDSGALVFGTSSDQSLGGTITGGGSLYQLGGGSLTLNAATSYTGGTTISGGTLALGIANALPSSGTVNVNGGVLNLANFNATVGQLVLTGGSINGTTGVLSAASYGLQSGAVSAILGGNSALTKSSSGLLVLSGGNTYTGGTTISAGTLELLTGGSLGGGNITITPGAVLETSGLSGGYTFGVGTLTAGRANSPATDIAGSLTLNNAAVSVVGPSSSGILTLSGSLTLNGATVPYVLGDQIAVGSALTLTGMDVVVPNSPLSAGTVTLFTYNGAAPNTAALATGGPFGTNSRQLYTFATSGGTAVTLTVAALPGNLQWIGGGSNVWYTGTNASANWCNANSSASDYFYASDNVIFSDSGSAAPSVIISGSVSPASLTVSNTAVNYTFNGGSIVGGTSLVKIGLGALKLAEANAYTGGTLIGGGTIALGINNALPTSGTLTLGSTGGNGSFDLAGFNQQVSGLAVAPGAAAASQIIISTSGNSTLNFHGGASVFGGTIEDTAGMSGGTLGLTVSSGTLDVRSGFTNYFGGTTVSGGAFLAAALPNTSGIAVGPAGNLAISGTNLGLAAVSNSGSILFTGSSGAITLAGLSGTGTTIFSAGANFPILSAGNVTVAGAAAIGSATGGTANLNGPTAAITNLGNSIVRLGNNALLSLSAGSQGSTSQISGQGSLDFTGTGTLALGGINTYSGATTINAGTLQVGVGSSGAFIGLTSDVLDNGNVVFNHSDAVAFSPPISGSGGLTQTGAGILNLTGSNNYSGPTALTGGMLQAGAANALSPNTAVAVSGGTLAATGFIQTVKSLTIGSSGALDITVGDTLTSSGAASFGGTLNLIGSSGTADLVSYLSYSGSFAVTNLPVGYTLQYTAAQLDLVPITSTTYNLAATAAASLLHLGGSTIVTATITNAGSGTADSLDYSGLVLSASAGSLSGPGLPISGGPLGQGQSSSGSQSYTATVPGINALTPFVSGGTNATLMTSAALGVTSSATLSVFNGSGTWSSSGGSLWSGNRNWIDANGVQAAPGTFAAFSHSDTANFTGLGSVTSIGLGGANPSLAALNFSGSNYSLSGGTLTLSSAGTASITVSGSQTINSLLSLASSADMIVNNSSDLLVLDGPVVGSAPLLKDGAGELILSNSTNGYNGGTYVRGGTLVDTASGAIPDGTALSIGPGTTLIFDSLASAGPAAPLVSSSAEVETVPEPGTLVLFTAGLGFGMGVAWMRRRAVRGAPLLLALWLMTGVSRADAPRPDLLDYFHACGIGDDAFARFSDDRQIAAEELDVIRRIAIRLRDCPTATQFVDRQNIRPAGRRLPLKAAAKSERGRMFQLQGSVVSVNPVVEPGSEPLWRCVVTTAENLRAVVYVAELTESLRLYGAGQRVAFDGLFVKYVPGALTEPMAVFVTRRIERRPDTPLGSLGMDYGLFEGIRDGTRMTAADHEGFYRLLQLTSKANSGQLDRDAERPDDSPAGLVALFRDPASQRGRLVKIAGIARRVVRVPIAEPATVARLGADHYYQIDIVADGSQDNPVVFCTLDIPPDIPLGEPPSYGESVEVTGFFLKSWQYPTTLSEGEKAANPGSFQALQSAPLVIGAAPRWKQAVAEKKNSSASVVTGLLLLVMIGVCLLLWHLRQTDQEFSRRVLARE